MVRLYQRPDPLEYEAWSSRIIRRCKKFERLIVPQTKQQTSIYLIGIMFWRRIIADSQAIFNPLNLWIKEKYENFFRWDQLKVNWKFTRGAGLPLMRQDSVAFIPGVANINLCGITISGLQAKSFWEISSQSFSWRLWKITSFVQHSNTLKKPWKLPLRFVTHCWLGVEPLAQKPLSEPI